MEENKIERENQNVDNEKNGKQTRQKRLISSWLMIIIILTSLCFIADFYFVINYSKDILIMVGAVIMTGIVVFLLIDEVGYTLEKSVKRKEEMFERYMKSQKAIYVAEKRGNKVINNSLQELKRGIEQSIDDEREQMITIEKAIARTQIKKMHEDILDVIDVIRSQNMEFPEELLEKISKEADNSSNDDTYNLAFDIEKLRQDIVNAVNMIHDECSEIKNILSNVEETSKRQVEKIEEVGQKQIDSIKEISVISAKTVEVVEQKSVEAVSAESEEEKIVLENISLEEIVKEDNVIKDIVKDEIITEEKILEDITSGNSPEVKGLENSQVVKELTPDVQADEEEPKVEENPVVEEEPKVEENPVVEEETIEEESKEKPEESAEPTGYVMSDDPNKKMSDDDIAALIASMGAGEPAIEENPTVEENPVVEEETIEEESKEKPEESAEPIGYVMSDDPNKKMSDDDIAALIASMTGN